MTLTDTTNSHQSSQPHLNSFEPFQPDELFKIIRRMKPTTCDLDPIPTKVFINCLDILISTITDIVNLSLSTGKFPSCLKTALVKPLLKKPGLDPNVLSNYRPISNLPFLSKVIERAVAIRLTSYLDRNHLLPQRQSAYRPGHSTETALLQVVDHLLRAVDKGNIVIMILLDLSAAFDTLNHNTLLLRLQRDFGLSEMALQWFKTYVSGRTQRVVTDSTKSEALPMTSGVPQGSVLGPVLFLLYTAPLSRIFEEHHIAYHLYADDTQLSAVSNPEPTSVKNILQDIELCSTKVKSWMDRNSLKMNEDKTEAIILGREIHLKNLHINTISIAGAQIKVSECVKYLGVCIDKHLTMEEQINHVVKVSHWQIRKIRTIRRFIPEKTAAMLFISLVISQMDYCNSLFFGITREQVHKLQLIQNVCARIIKLSPPRAHISPVLEDLH